MSTWKEISDQFRELVEPLKYTRLDAQWGSSGEYWRFAGDSNKNAQKRYNALSRIAGKKLEEILTPGTSAHDELLDENNLIWRWYKAIWKIGGNFDYGPTGEEKTQAGEHVGYIQTGTIHDIAEAASVLCLELSSMYAEENGAKKEDSVVVNRYLNWLKKRNYNWGAIAAVVAILALITTLAWNYYSDYVNKRLHHQHLKPDISCSMEYPIKVEGEKVFRNKRNPDVIVRNNGPIKAVSVSCDVKIYVYNGKNDKITNFVDAGFRGFDHVVSARVLEPFNELRYSSIGVNGEDLIAIYSVSVSYHRESDMEPFSLQKYFFTENGKISADNEFKKDSRYNQIIEKVKSFAPSESDDSRFVFTGAAEDTWFFESDPSVKVRENADGSITIATPKDQGEIPQVGYPFLEIKPKPFKATGFYTEAQIVEDHIEVKIPFEVKNIGDTAAIITEDGFEPTITIEPNDTKFYTRTIEVGRAKDNQKPLETFVKLLDTEDRMFHLKFSILYRPGNDTDKLFKSGVHYEIGKNKVMPIRE